jgi:hypothetical protein
MKRDRDTADFRGMASRYYERLVARLRKEFGSWRNFLAT